MPILYASLGDYPRARAIERDKVELLIAHPGGGDSNSKPSSDVRLSPSSEHQHNERWVPERSGAEPVSGEQVLPQLGCLFSGPNSAKPGPNSAHRMLQGRSAQRITE